MWFRRRDFVGAGPNSRINRPGSLLGQTGGGAAFSVAFTGLSTDSLGSYGLIGNHAAIGFTITPDLGTETVKWSNSSNPADAATFGTGASPTDFASVDGFSVWLHVTDDPGDGPVTRSFSFPARITPATAAGAISAQTWTVDDTTVNLNAATDFTANGNTLTYSASGLPAGVTINSAGTISGTPTAVSSGNVVVTATDAYGRLVTSTFTQATSLRTQATAANGITAQTWTVDDTTVNLNAATDFTANGNTLTYSATGLPAGVTINSAGTISGTPTAASSGSVVVTAADEYGRQTTSTFSQTTALRTQATAANALGPYSFTEGVAISATNLAADFTANGNTLTYAMVAALPSALVVSSAGSMTGTPAATIVSASYTVRATDEYGRQTDSTFSLAVVEASAGPNFYVDSVGGSDSNDGLTEGAAFQTLSKTTTEAVAFGNGVHIALKRGSHWREAIDLSLNDVTIEDYGTGDLPILDGANVVSSWTPDGFWANVFTASVTHDGSGSDRFRVWENGEQLTRVANLSTCSSTPGSFVDARSSTDPSPATIKIHPTGSGNPNSNGNTYEISVRRRGLKLTGSGAVVSGVHARRAMANNGAIDVSAVTANRALSVDGTKHNVFWSQGAIEDVLAYRADVPPSYEPSSTFFVAYDIDATGKSVSMRRCGAWGGASANYGNGTFMTMHDSSSNYYSSFEGEQLWAAGNISNALQPSALTSTVNGHYNKFRSGSLNGWYSNTATARYFQVNHATTSTAVFGNFRGSTGATDARTFLIENTVIYSGATGNELFRSGSVLDGTSLTLRNCVIYIDGGFRAPWAAVSGVWSSGNLTIENCIFVVASFTASVVVPTGIVYTGDNNVFVLRDNATIGTRLRWSLNGTTYQTLADWQTASSQDANSVVMSSTDLATLFSGTVANGDFRLGATGAGLVASGLSAGPQNHWDWNARAVASGPPQRWPVVPESLADAQTYSNNPVAWDFYP